MKISCIYIIKSKAKPGAFYIGSTMDFNHRKWRHERNFKLDKHPNSKIKYHVRKYGPGDLLIEVLEIIPDPTCLMIMEQQYIDSMTPTLNVRLIAESNRGFKHTKETKKKIGLRHKGVPKSEECKKKISSARTGKRWTIEMKEQYKGSRTGIKRPPFSEKWKENMRMARIRNIEKLKKAS